MVRVLMTGEELRERDDRELTLSARIAALEAQLREREGDPLTISCCHPDVIAAAKKRAAQIDVPVMVRK
jgi:hypothetical protein